MNKGNNSSFYFQDLNGSTDCVHAFRSKWRSKYVSMDKCSHFIQSGDVNLLSSACTDVGNVMCSGVLHSLL